MWGSPPLTLYVTTEHKDWHYHSRRFFVLNKTDYIREINFSKLNFSWWVSPYLLLPPSPRHLPPQKKIVKLWIGTQNLPNDVGTSLCFNGGSKKTIRSVWDTRRPVFVMVDNIINNSLRSHKSVTQSYRSANIRKDSRKHSIFSWKSEGDWSDSWPIPVVEICYTLTSELMFNWMCVRWVRW
jgi:hypothetical protein